jgi:hypothetical protein
MSEVRALEALSLALDVLLSEVDGRLVLTDRLACPVDGLETLLSFDFLYPPLMLDRLEDRFAELLL